MTISLLPTFWIIFRVPFDVGATKPVMVRDASEETRITVAVVNPDGA